MNEQSGSPVGKISLGFAIGGIALPLIVALLVIMFVEAPDRNQYFRWCWFSFGGLELVGLVTGIVGRKTDLGRPGLALSTVSFLLFAVITAYLTLREVVIEETPNNTIEETSR